MHQRAELDAVKIAIELVRQEKAAILVQTKKVSQQQVAAYEPDGSALLGVCS
jgi:hypothetical protein